MGKLYLVQTNGQLGNLSCQGVGIGGTEKRDTLLNVTLPYNEQGYSYGLNCNDILITHPLSVKLRVYGEVDSVGVYIDNDINNQTLYSQGLYDITQRIEENTVINFVMKNSSANAYVIIKHTSENETIADTIVSLTDFNTDWEYAKPNQAYASCTLPHSVNSVDQDQYNYYRGEVRYRKNIEMTPTKKYYIYLYGCNQRGTVSLNGTHVCDLGNAYQAGIIDFSNVPINEGYNLLEVTLTNASDRSCIPFAADFNFYNGLDRMAKIFETGRLCIDPVNFGTHRMHAIQTVTGATTGTVRMTTKILNHYTEQAQVNVVLSVKTSNNLTVKATRTLTITVPENGYTNIDETFDLTDIYKWNGLNDFATYNCIIELSRVGGNQLDSVQVRTGFRTFQVEKHTTAADGPGFYLNGSAYRLYGTNYHTDKQGRAQALTTEDYTYDINLMGAMKPSMIKFAHYTCDHTLLDYCDTHGIVVMLEIPWSRNFPSQENQYAEAYRTNVRNAMLNMIKEYYNHPSVCFWCFDNELDYSIDPVLGFDSEECHVFMRDLYNEAKQLDSQRIIGAGFWQNRNNERGWTDVCDIMLSTHYMGWYSGSVSGSLGNANADNAEMAMPKAINEYGYGSNPNQHVTWDQAPNSKPASPNLSSTHYEEYQMYCLEQYLKQFENIQWPVFNLQWAFNDFAVYSRNEGSVPRTNTKGIITRDRTIIKDAYYLYKAYWNPEKMVHICQKRWMDRGEGVSQVLLHIYSNCSKLELYQNNNLIQTLNSYNGTLNVCWDFSSVDLVTGTNTFEVKGYDENGSYITSDTWIFAAQSILVQSIAVQLSDEYISTSESCTATVTVTPAGATNPNVVWSISPIGKATIDANTGVVSPNGYEDIYTITATAADGSLVTGQASLIISNTAPQITSINVTNTQGIAYALATNESNTSEGLTLNAQVMPSTMPQGVTWESQDMAKATIDANTGVITVLGEGNVTFVARSSVDTTKTGTITLYCIPEASTIDLTGKIGYVPWTLPATDDTNCAVYMEFEMQGTFNQPAMVFSTMRTGKVAFINAAVFGRDGMFNSYTPSRTKLKSQTVWSDTSANTSLHTYAVSPVHVGSSMNGFSSLDNVALTYNDVYGSRLQVADPVDVIGLNYECSDVIDGMTQSQLDSGIANRTLVPKSEGRVIKLRRLVIWNNDPQFTNLNEMMASIGTAHVNLIGTANGLVNYGTNGEAVVMSQISVNTKIVTAITVTLESPNIAINGTINAHNVLTPIDAENQNVTWSSDDETIATIDPVTGVITGVSEGTCNIIATSQDIGGVSGSAELSVTSQYTQIQSFSVADNLPYAVGIANEQGFLEGCNLTVDIQPAEANHVVNWVSSQPSIVSVHPTTGILTMTNLTQPTEVVFTATSTQDPTKYDSKTVMCYPDYSIFDLTSKTGYVAWTPPSSTTANITIYAEFEMQASSDNASQLFSSRGTDRPEVFNLMVPGSTGKLRSTLPYSCRMNYSQNWADTTTNTTTHTVFISPHRNGSTFDGVATLDGFNITYSNYASNIAYATDTIGLNCEYTTGLNGKTAAEMSAQTPKSADRIVKVKRLAIWTNNVKYDSIADALNDLKSAQINLVGVNGTLINYGTNNNQPVISL